MRAIVPWLLVPAVLPRVEDPWPDAIGIGFPFTTAGGGVVLAGLVFATATSKRRERAMVWGSVVGFGIGIAFHVVALVAQVIAGL
jgi:hypothetical protein